MTEKLKQTIKEEVAKLPKETQEVVNSLDWAGIVEEIGKKHLLDESEVNDLQAVTLVVLVGLIGLDLYAKNIEDEVGTSKDEAEKIASEAMEKIFDPIAERIEEGIKEKVKDKKGNWEQNVNFVLGGGDYTALMEERNDAAPE